MGYKAAVQVLKRADALKLKLSSRQPDLLNDLQAWTDQQQLQTIYHKVLVLDLEYALDKKVEQELWTLGFKNHISALQEQARDKKNPRRSDCQALLSWCLEAASGFYLTLLQELCSTYDLDLPFRKRGAVFGNFKGNGEVEPSGVLPQSSSCLYICQYCLVHLGDIARYRNQRKQAESFYKHAIQVSPNSGHPYNQLALLEASQGDKLSTVFHYMRGIAVKNPFPGASTNLSNTLSNAIDKDDPITEIVTKMSVSEFTSLFLRSHSLLHNDSDLPQAELCVKSVTSTLTALVATQSFTAGRLIKMTVINLFALKKVVGDEVDKLEVLTEDEKKVRELVMDLIAGSLSAFLLPVYTLKTDETLLDYCALPAIRLISMWIKNEPSVLKEAEFANRLQIWPGYCKLLNSLQLYIKDNNYDKYKTIPLSYDRELQGFQPLRDTFKTYDFKLDPVDAEVEKKIRAKRLVQFGEWLTTFDLNGNKLIICNKNEKTGQLDFEPGCIQPDPTDQLLEEMKSFKVTDNETKIKGPEKRGGILKPQGSLEKAREERVVKMTNDEDTERTISMKMDSTKMKRVSQNVALQSIYKKIEENKQVKFSTETTDKEKEKTSPKVKPPIQRQPPPMAQTAPNPSYRTQAFNQNHPALANLTLDKPPNDFYNVNFPPPTPQNNLLDRPHQYPTNDMLGIKPPQFNIQPPMYMNMPPPQPPQQQNSFTPLIEKPLTFSMPPQFGGYQKEERAQNAWWPQSQTGSYQQQDYYRFNNMGNYGAGSNADMFASAWSNPPRGYGPLPPQQHSSSSMSMRQAMLNEAKHLNGSNNASNINNAPGYSLFNPTSWAPSLPGQLRNTSAATTHPGDMQRQQSLFTGHGPQSLQQLLEQQNQLQKGDT